MTFLELKLFQERLYLATDTFDAFNIANLVVPFVELCQMGRERSLVHGQDLVDLAVDHDVDHGELSPGQILVLV